MEAVLVLLLCPEGDVRGDNRGDRIACNGLEAGGFLSGEGENKPPLLEDTLGFFSSEPLAALSEDFLLLSEVSFSLLIGFSGEPANFEWEGCKVGDGSDLTRDSCFTVGCC